MASEIKSRVASHWRKGAWVVRVLARQHTIASKIASEPDAWALAKAYAKVKKTIAYRFDDTGRIAQREDYSK